MHSLMRRLTLVWVCLAVVALLACGEAPREEPEAPAETVGQHMKQHFNQVKDVQEAVIRGDLEGLETPAQWIVEHQAAEGLPQGWEPHVTEMKNAAKLIIEAADVDGAAMATAAMAKACGACHQAMGIKPSIRIDSLPPDDTGTVPHMVGHMWAADRMWEGLIIPADESWGNGVGVLAGAPLHSEDLTEDVGERDDLDALAARVHELASHGSKTDGLDARAKLYGEFLATCAKCHQMLGQVGPQ